MKLKKIGGYGLQEKWYICSTPEWPEGDFWFTDTYPLSEVWKVKSFVKWLWEVYK